jgi:integrase
VPRSATGTIEARALVDGTRAYHLRFLAADRRELVVLHERSACTCGCGGGWSETAARTELRNLKARVRASVRQRPPSGTDSRQSPALGPPLFEKYARRWLLEKIEGTTGPKPISAHTANDYRWRLEQHLVPFFGHYRLDEIDEALCQQFKAKKLRDAAEQRKAIASGVVLRDERNRRIVPLGPSSLRKLTSTVASILQDAVEDKHITHNPARGRRMRVHVPRPKRSFLEIDELVSLFDAAAEQDQTLDPFVAADELGATTFRVAGLLAEDQRPKQVAQRLGIAPSTVTYHLKLLRATPSRGYAVRRTVVEILGRSGLRASELCELRVGHVRLSGPSAARLTIVDAKSEAGIREVQMTPELTRLVTEHLVRLRRTGLPTGLGDYLVPNSRGGRLSRQRVARIVGDAATLASEHRTGRGLSPVPHTTPHSLRRTYISIALLANQFDVKWVMHQVGHADSRMTLDVYAQLQRRIDRGHGASFDRLVRAARDYQRIGDEKATGGIDRTSRTNIDVTLATS